MRAYPEPPRRARVDPEALLRKRLAATEVRRAIFALVAIATGGGVVAIGIVLYLAEPAPAERDTPIAGVIAVVAMGVLFILPGLRFLYRVLTRRARIARLLGILRAEPERVARIYGARMGPSPGRQRVPLSAQEERTPTGLGLHIVIELVERSRLRRLLGSHKHVVIARPAEIPVLLAHLRAQAPNAQGPPR